MSERRSSFQRQAMLRDADRVEPDRTTCNSTPRPSWRNSRRSSQGSFTHRRSSLNSSFGCSEVDDEREHYWLPPPTPGSSEEPLRVDFRCACFKLSNISTVDFTTNIKFVIVFEWIDERFRGTDMTTNDLPADLWGPDVILENAQNECEVIYDSFLLLNTEAGRMKRTVTFHGPVFNPMDLEGFPFDNDELELKFISICNWRTLDGTRFGNDPVSRVYNLHPMLKNESGVDFFFFGWGGKVNEFNILGWSQDVQNPPEACKPLSFQFDIHLTRKVQFYYLKILLPLWLLVLTSLAAYALETDDLASRLEFLVTLLLSTIAFLYIVQESLPKMGHLTVIDQVVLSSLLALVLSIFFSFLVSVSSTPYTLNIILAIVNQVVYFLVNLYLVLPPHWRYRKHKAKMIARQAIQDSKEMAKSGRLLPGRQMRKSSMDFNKSFSLNATVSMRGDHERRRSSVEKAFSARHKKMLEKLDEAEDVKYEEEVEEKKTDSVDESS